MMSIAAGASLVVAWEFAPAAHGAPQASPAAQQPPAPAIPSSVPAAASPQATPQPPTQPPAKPTLNLVVLDPGHGGTDSGARGDNGGIEKDIVLVFARAAKIMLEQQGFQVVATRQGDEDPSFDERAAVANAQRDAVVVTLHIATTGPASTVRTYYYEFQSSSAATPAASIVGLGPNSSAAASALPILPTAAANIATGRLVPWEEAQMRYVSASRRFADLTQAEFARSFPGSPALSAAAPERDLRSVAAPAIAVEISSVDASTPQQLDAMSGSLGAAIARAVVAYRAVYDPGDK